MSALILSAPPPTHPQPTSHRLSAALSWGLHVRLCLLWKGPNSQGEPVPLPAPWGVLLLVVLPVGRAGANGGETVAPGLRFSQMSETQKSWGDLQRGKNE